MSAAESQTPTAYATICDGACGLVYMTEREYDRQMAQPGATWRCARCGQRALWSDEVYEEAMFPTTVSKCECCGQELAERVDKKCPRCAFQKCRCQLTQAEEQAADARIEEQAEESARYAAEDRHDTVAKEERRAS